MALNLCIDLKRWTPRHENRQQDAEASSPDAITYIASGQHETTTERKSRKKAETTNDTETTRKRHGNDKTTLKRH